MTIRIDPYEPLALPQTEWRNFQAPTCKPGEHEGSLVFKDHEHAGRRFYWECDHCGGMQGPLKKGTYSPEDAITFRDIRGSNYEEVSARREEARAQDRERWLAEHSEYLRSAEWSALRRKVIERDKNICQGCLDQPGHHVHHLTYRRWRRELLIDLVLLCVSCHDRAHESETEGT
jgi:5-methylcytosine-specific restriction endonuclease McrA